MRALCRRVFVMAAVSLATPLAASSQTLTAVWDPNPASDNVINYEVCIGTTSLSCNFKDVTVPASQTTYTFLPNPGVLYHLAVRAISAGGAGAYSPEVSVSVPSLSVPSNRTSNVNVPITPFTLSASDPDGGPLQFSHTGLPFGLSLNQSTGTISGTPSSTGTYNVMVFVTDGLSTAAAAFVWTIQNGSSDATAPTVAITSHTANQTVSVANITLAGTATDSGAGNSGIASVTVNGVAASGGTATTSNTANWSRALTLTGGANVLTVVATDGVGNARTSQITINYSAPDTTAPTLAITSNTNNQVVNVANITLAGTATDSNAGGSGVTSVTVNGAAATGGTSTGSNTANWSRAVALAAGSNTLTVVATDGANNARQSQITVKLDTAAPALAISSHTSGQTVTTSTITLSGTASDSATGGSGIASVTVNGATTTGGSVGGTGTANWSRSVSLAVGANAITVNARDGAGNVTPNLITINRSGPLTLTGITSNLVSPQLVNSTVTFTASAAGGVQPYQFKWWVSPDGVNWTMVQDWSTASTYSWTPGVAGTGYRVGVWARSAGVTTDVSSVNLSVPFTVTGPQPLSVTGLTSSLPSPQVSGTAITFDASAAGGTGPYQFKWWLFDGVTWTIGQDWGPGTFVWTPTTANAHYRVGIWVRNAGVTADVSNVNLSVPYPITAAASIVSQPISLTSITSNPPGPVSPGTPVTFTANATGGTAPYQFKWWIWNGTAWVMARDWGSSTFDWTPSVANSNHRVGVWVRSATTAADISEANLSVPFPVTGTASGPLTALVIGSSVPSPVRSNTSVTFTAVAAGGAGQYQFKWWVFDGILWTMVQDWTSSATFSWTPTTANANYRVGIWVRSVGSNDDTGSVNLSIPVAVIW